MISHYVLHHMTVAMCLFTIQEEKEKEKENKRKREIKLEKIDKKKRKIQYIQYKSSSIP